MMHKNKVFCKKNTNTVIFMQYINMDTNPVEIPSTKSDQESHYVD